MQQLPSRLRLNISAAVASVTTGTVLVILKLWALWETGALAIAASLTDSAMDLMMSAVGLVAIIYAARPADADHAFGHDSVEDLTSLGQAVFIFGSACIILWAAIARLMSPDHTPIKSEGLGIAIMAISAVITMALVLWQRHVARTTGNKVVAADMLHYVGDLIPTIGAIVALIAAGTFGFTSVDSIFAIAAAVFMLYGAGKIAGSGWHALMDRSASDEVLDGINAIAAATDGVRGFHDLKTRTSGARLFVQIHVELEGEQSLRNAHAIAATLKRNIVGAYPYADVIVHMDVWRPPVTPNHAP